MRLKPCTLTMKLVSRTGDVVEAGVRKMYCLAALRTLTPAGSQQAIVSEARGHLEVGTRPNRRLQVELYT